VKLPEKLILPLVVLLPGGLVAVAAYLGIKRFVKKTKPPKPE
jgi:hypothetical protein